MPYICRSDFYKKTNIDCGENDDWLGEFRTSKSRDIPHLKSLPLIGYMDPVLDGGTPDAEINPPNILEQPVDVYGSSRIFFVSPESKAIIESIEPGLHDFVPMEMRYGRETKERDFEIRYTEGDPYTSHPFYLCRINQHIDAVDTEKSEGEVIEQSNGNKIFLKKSTAPLSLKTELIEGKHLWFYDFIFISDELLDALQAQSLGIGWRYEKQVVVK